MRRLAVMAVATMTVVLGAACTGGSKVNDAGPAPTRQPGAPAQPAGPDDSGTAADPAAGADGTATVSLWLTQGDTLHRIARTVPKVTGIGAVTLQALLAGPTPEEKRAGVGTAIPDGTRLLGLTIDDATARVDLSRQFEVTGDDEGVILSLAQVTCTIDQFDSVTGVRFALDGQDVAVLAGDGTVTDRPLTCRRFGQPEAAPTPVDAGIWPFTSAAEADASVDRGDRTFLDPVVTAREFASRYLGMDDPVVFDFRESGPADGEVGVGFRYGEGGAPIDEPGPTTTVIVRQLGRQGGSGAWSVTAAWSPDIEVTSPQPLASVSSPVPLGGRADVFEGHVNVSVREDGMLAGAALGEGFVTGGGGGELGPFDGAVAYRAPSAPGGAVVFSERAGDGQVLRATVVRVRFGG
ncbi:MAG: GerMN domain-containing protein [Acidimicrobiales bacterium]